MDPRVSGNRRAPSSPSPRAFIRGAAELVCRREFGPARLSPRLRECPSEREAPAPMRLPGHCGASLLAAGAGRGSPFALSHGRCAFLVPRERGAALAGAVRRSESMLRIRPEKLVHDLDADDPGTRYAHERAAREALPAVAVQRQHALLAACLADHGLEGPVLGVAFDEPGRGPDGSTWGGEFLVGGAGGFRRAGHLEAVPFVGPEPWEMALAVLLDCGGDSGRIAERLPRGAADEALRSLGRAGLPRTSSAAGLFDAVTSILGVRDVALHGFSAAADLEGIARRSPDARAYPVDLLAQEGSWVVRVGPTLAAMEKDLVRETPVSDVARRFHATAAAMIRAALLRLREESGLSDVVLCGSLFENALLLADTLRVLGEERFRVLRPRTGPTEAALCLGQLAVAAVGGGDRAVP